MKYKNETPWKSDLYWTSNYNFKEEIRKDMELPERVIIHDATLRDGEQTPGVVFRKKEKIEIAKKLDEVGVNRIEAGMPAVSEEDAAAITEISKMNMKADIFSFVRASKTDIEKSAQCGVRGVVIEVPIGEPKLTMQFNWTWEDVLRKSIESINYARSLGMYVTYFPYDTTRSKESDLENLLTRLMQEAPPDSIGIVDTTGCCTPRAMAYLVKKVKALTGVTIEVHTHNDIGMGVASEMAAIEAGASVVHTSVNGLGERSGNAALEEVVVALRTLYGFETTIQFGKLKELSELVEKLSGFPVGVNKAVVGNGTFMRESGIGIDKVLHEPLAMFSLNPKFVGLEPCAVLGKKSGLASVELKLNQFGLTADKDQTSAILKEIKDLGLEKKALVTDEEFMSIYKKVMGK